MSKTMKVTRGATLGLDLAEVWKRDDYSAEDAAPLDWKQLDAAIDARHAALATERAEAETAEALEAAKRAALADAADAYNRAALEDDTDALEVSAEAMAEALEAERDSMELARLEDAEWYAERADTMQVFTSHVLDAERQTQARVTLEDARRSVSYQAASVMLASMPRRANVMFATRSDSLTIQAFTLEAVAPASSIIPRLRVAERLEASDVAKWDAAASQAEAEALVSFHNKPTRNTAARLEITQNVARESTRAAHTLRNAYAYASSAPRYAVKSIPVATFTIPVAFSISALIQSADNIAGIVPVRSDIHPFPSKLGRGNTTGTTQATKPGTRLILSERSSRVVDPYDATAEAKRAARRERDYRRTGQTVKNRATARVIALSDFQTGLELMATARAHADAERIAAERMEADRERRAEAARQRRAKQTAEDKAARNMALRNKRRAAKNKA